MLNVFRHGDMLFLDIQSNTAKSMNETASAGPSLALTESSSLLSRPLSAGMHREVTEDEVDQFLWKQDGKIARERNEQLLVFTLLFLLMCSQLFQICFYCLIAIDCPARLMVVSVLVRNEQHCDFAILERSRGVLWLASLILAECEKQMNSNRREIIKLNSMISCS